MGISRLKERSPIEDIQGDFFIYLRRNKLVLCCSKKANIFEIPKGQTQNETPYTCEPFNNDIGFPCIIEQLVLHQVLNVRAAQILVWSSVFFSVSSSSILKCHVIMNPLFSLPNVIPSLIHSTVSMTFHLNVL